MKNCTQCQSSFEIAEVDKKFYQKMEVPEPTLCPDCRQQRRLICANQINLYKRKCDVTGKAIISHYDEKTPLKVYHPDYWISDEVDNTEYGRDFDFSRPFFEQWYELSKLVPRRSLVGGLQFNENSDYVNYAGFNKSCYMIFDSDYNWDCYYSLGLNKSKSSIDCLRSKECELCYECIDCYQSYRLFYSQDSTNCSNSAFLKNCIGCKNCFMCSNLKNKEYYIYNKPYDKETFEKLMASLSKHSELEKYMEGWEDFKLKFPQKYIHGVQNEKVTGDYLIQSKNCEACFDSMELWDCKYFTRSFGNAKDCLDCDECGDGAELLYESNICGFNTQNLKFCFLCINQSSNLTYCQHCDYTSDCFGCIGIKRKKYCILNKQYTKEEYEALVPKIIEHMKKTPSTSSGSSTGEWGEFFPSKYSDFAYNETIAQEYFPLSKEEALSKGYQWKEKDQQEYQPPTTEIPNSSQEASKALCQELFSCEKCKRNYKIIEQELDFYKNQGLPLPKNCFYCRHAARFDKRNKRKLYERNCQKCEVKIQTTYSSDRPEKVYCEQCYLSAMY